MDVHLDTVYKRLVEEEKLHFEPVPEPEEDEYEEKPRAAEYAAELGWRTPYELSDVSKPKSLDGSLPVLHYVKRLDQSVPQDIGRRQNGDRGICKGHKPDRENKAVKLADRQASQRGAGVAGVTTVPGDLEAKPGELLSSSAALFARLCHELRFWDIHGGFDLIVQSGPGQVYIREIALGVGEGFVPQQLLKHWQRDTF